MALLKHTRRFFPASLTSLWYWYRFGAKVSPRAEVELSPTVELGRGTQIGSFCKIKASGPLVIGANTQIATGCFLGAGPKGLHIGEDCLMGPNCVVLTGEYRYDDLAVPLRLQGHISKGTRIGRNVFIGAGTVIVAGSNVGDDVIIAAGSIVSGTVPAATIVSGNPAKVLFQRR